MSDKKEKSVKSSSRKNKGYVSKTNCILSIADIEFLAKSFKTVFPFVSFFETSDNDISQREIWQRMPSFTDDFDNKRSSRLEVYIVIVPDDFAPKYNLVHSKIDPVPQVSMWNRPRFAVRCLLHKRLENSRQGRILPERVSCPIDPAVRQMPFRYSTRDEVVFYYSASSYDHLQRAFVDVIRRTVNRFLYSPKAIIFERLSNGEILPNSGNCEIKPFTESCRYGYFMGQETLTNPHVVLGTLSPLCDRDVELPWWPKSLPPGDIGLIRADPAVLKKPPKLPRGPAEVADALAATLKDDSWY